MNDKIDFPYRDTIYTDDDKIRIFKLLLTESLSKYSNESYTSYPNIKISNIDYLYGGKYVYLMSDPKNKYQLYMLSDLFNDHCRAMCRFGLHESPYVYYKKNKQLILDELAKRKLEPTKLNIREQIYLQTVECSIHNPLIIKYFIKKFQAKTILDFSSGWGDRTYWTASSVSFLKIRPCCWIRASICFVHLVRRLEVSQSVALFPFPV